MQLPKSNFWRQYRRRGSATQPCQVNHILIDRSNTWEHELTKSLLSVMIAKGIPANIYDDIKEIWNECLRNLKDPLESNIVDSQGRVFYTEAEKETGDVIDVVDISDELEVEVMFKNNERSVKEKYLTHGRYCATVDLDR